MAADALAYRLRLIHMTDRELAQEFHRQRGDAPDESRAIRQEIAVRWLRQFHKGESHG